VSRGFATLAALVGLAAVAVGARSLVGHLGAPTDDVPAFVVEAGPFSRSVGAEGVLKPVTASPVSAPSDGRALLIAWMADDGATVKKGDVVVRFDKTDAVRALADGEADERAADARIAKEKRVISGAIADRTRAANLTKVEIDHAKRLGRKDPRFFPRTEVIESQIDEGLLAARLTKTEGSQVAEERLGKSRVQFLVVDRQKADIQRKEAAKILEGLEVRAPHDGTFVIQRMGWAQRIIQTGDRAFPGMRIAEVATNERMEAEVLVLEADAGGLTAGKRATVTLEAQPDVVYVAKVKKVDPFPKTRHPEVPTQYFGAILSIEGETRGLKPGQRLRANIVLDQINSALVIPRQAVSSRAGGVFVERRRKGGGWETVKVSLGSGSVGRVVVTEGLQPGDRIALRDTAQSAEEAISTAPKPVPKPSTPAGPPGGGRR
jgi:HlyD family secretion protein